MKLFTIILLIFLSTSAKAQFQQEQVKNLPDYDEKPVHFGFTVGTNIMDFNITKADNFFSQYEFGQVFAIENESTIGFHLGPVANFRLSKSFDFRVLVDLSFGARNLSYLIVEDTNDVQETLSKHNMKINSTYLDVPLLIKYKSVRINNYRPYLIGGISPRIDLAAQKKIKPEEMPKIRLKNIDVAWELGGGIDFYLPYFKFSTELKYSKGVRNIMVYDDTQFSSAIKHLNSSIWTISLHFEGSL